MAKIKNNIKKNFTIVPNELVLDNSISDRARFIFVYIASKPDDWDFYMPSMCKELKLSEDTVRKYVKELTLSGWIINHGQQQLENGQWSAVYYELLSEKTQPLEIQPQKKPNTEIPVGENSCDGKKHTHNNKYSNKEVILTKKEENNITKMNLNSVFDFFSPSYNNLPDKFKKRFTENEVKSYLSFCREFEKYSSDIKNNDFITISEFNKEFKNVPADVLRKAILKIFGIGINYKTILSARLLDAISWDKDYTSKQSTKTTRETVFDAV